MRSEKNIKTCFSINFSLSPEDEGRMLFFPAWLQHMVYPFYECEENRVTISGNIRMYVPNKPKEREESRSTVEEKEMMLELMENNVEELKKKLKQMKKAGKKEE